MLVRMGKGGPVLVLQKDDMVPIDIGRYRGYTRDDPDALRQPVHKIRPDYSVECLPVFTVGMNWTHDGYVNSRKCTKTHLCIADTIQVPVSREDAARFMVPVKNELGDVAL